MHNSLKKINTAIFFSGRGSNMESLIKATKNQNFPASIPVVITNNKSAPGIQLAKNHFIPVEILDKNKFNRSEFESNSQKILLDYKIEMICLAGFMQILSKKLRTAKTDPKSKRGKEFMAHHTIHSGPHITGQGAEHATYDFDDDWYTNKGGIQRRKKKDKQKRGYEPVENYSFITLKNMIL